MLGASASAEPRRVLIIQSFGREFVLAVIHDMSERRKSELEMERHRQELAHVSRESIMGELSASMAHELNQPLTAILTNAQAALRFLGSSQADVDEFRDILRDIAHDTTRARDVIRHLRALVRKSKPDFTRLDIGETVREVVGFLHGDIVARNVRVVLELAPDLPPVRGDRIQLEQVMMNLLMNAFDALNGNPIPERIVTVTTAADSEAVQVAVRDLGPGIPPDRLEPVFEPFYTTKPEGLGMGLSVTRSIIETHHGRIWAEHNAGRGATFHFRLAVASLLTAT
jgi:two-component system sensor kinase FixL